MESCYFNRPHDVKKTADLELQGFCAMFLEAKFRELISLKATGTMLSKRASTMNATPGDTSDHHLLLSLSFHTLIMIDF